MSCPYAAPLAGDASTASTSSLASSSPLGGPATGGSGDDHGVMEALALAKSACPAFQKGTGCPFREATDREAMKRAMLSVPPSHIGIVKVGGGDGGGGGEKSEARNKGDEGAGSSSAATADTDVSDKFRKALEHVHAVSVALHSPDGPAAAGAAAAAKASAAEDGTAGTGGRFSPDFMLDGGCPFKTYTHTSPSSAGASDAQVPFVNAMEDFSLGAIIARMADEESQEIGEGGKGEDEDEDEDEDEGEDESVRVEHDAGYTGSVDAPSAPQAAQQPAASRDQSIEPIAAQQEEGEGGTQNLSISAALQTGTAESHQAAESVHFVSDFVKGKIDRELYAALVSDLYHVYKTLEEQLDSHGPQHFPTLHHPEELERTSSLEDDVEYFHGYGWEDMDICKPSPATSDYVDRINYISSKEPLLLLSHAYTRYLGDLSGGRILARVARKALNLKGSKDGLRFYEFERIANPKKFKDGYRRALDDLPLTSDQVDRLVAEANVAFVLNMRVFEELDVRAGVDGAKVRPLEEATCYYDQVVEEQPGRRRPSATRRGSQGSVDGAADAKCPFAYLGGPNPHGEKGGEGTAVPAARAPPQRADEGTPNGTAVVPSHSGEKQGRCPWPFVFFHDPAAGMRDYQTWVVISLVLFYVWSTARHDIVKSLANVDATMAPVAVVAHLFFLIGAYGVTKRM